MSVNYTFETEYFSHDLEIIKQNVDTFFLILMGSLVFCKIYIIFLISFICDSCVFIDLYIHLNHSIETCVCLFRVVVCSA